VGHRLQGKGLGITLLRTQLTRTHLPTQGIIRVGVRRIASACMAWEWDGNGTAAVAHRSWRQRGPLCWVAVCTQRKGFFLNSSSYQIFKCIYRILNMDENKNQLYNLIEIYETNLLSLVSLWLDNNYQLLRCH
jgi:hypothetical protein